MHDTSQLYWVELTDGRWAFCDITNKLLFSVYILQYTSYNCYLVYTYYSIRNVIANYSFNIFFVSNVHYIPCWKKQVESSSTTYNNWSIPRCRVQEVIDWVEHNTPHTALEQVTTYLIIILLYTNFLHQCKPTQISTYFRLKVLKLTRMSCHTSGLLTNHSSWHPFRILI